MSPVTGTKTATCSHNYFTCITCATTDAEVTTIQVQTNNLPNKCWEHNSSSPNVAGALAVDFTVTFNALMLGINNYDFDDFIDSADVDLVLCDISRTDEANMHISITYSEPENATTEM